MWAAILKVVIDVLRAVLPSVFKEMKKPTEITPIGNDKEVDDAWNKFIEDDPNSDS